MSVPSAGNDTTAPSTAYLSIIGDTSYSYIDRNHALHSAFDSACYPNDSARTDRLNAFIDTCLKSLKSESSSVFKRKMRMETADAYNELQDSADAYTYYRQITDEQIFSLDSLVAGWRIQILDSSINNPQSGGQLASAFGNYVNRVHNDIYRYIHRTDSVVTDTNIQSPKIQNSAPNDIPLITLLQVIPNPFTNKTEFKFTLAYTQELKMEIYDVLGRKLLDLDLGVRSSGEDSYELNTQKWPSGTYFARFVSSDGKVSTVTLKKD